MNARGFISWLFLLAVFFDMSAIVVYLHNDYAGTPDKGYKVTVQAKNPDSTNVVYLKKNAIRSIDIEYPDSGTIRVNDPKDKGGGLLRSAQLNRYEYDLWSGRYYYTLTGAKPADNCDSTPLTPVFAGVPGILIYHIDSGKCSFH